MPAYLAPLAAYFGVMAGTFIVPVVTPSVPTLYVAKFAPPWAIALAGSIATAIAASIDYHLVRRAFRLALLERARAHRFFALFERWAKVAPFVTIVLFAGLPMPFFPARILMPISGYPARRYAAAAAIGRFPRFYVVSYIGHELAIPNWVLLAMLAVGLGMGCITAIVRRARDRRAAREKEAAPPDTAA